MQKKRCADLVADAFASRMADIRLLWRAEQGDKKAQKQAKKIGLGELSDYGICLDVVEAGTYEGQREDYKRYQLSWGGPSEEFRIYKNGDVEFWLLNWFDGAKIDVEGEDADIIRNIADLIEWK